MVRSGAQSFSSDQLFKMVEEMVFEFSTLVMQNLLRYTKSLKEIIKEMAGSSLSTFISTWVRLQKSGKVVYHSENIFISS